jgi:AcrR family transcriptional regulator
MASEAAELINEFNQLPENLCHRLQLCLFVAMPRAPSSRKIKQDRAVKTREHILNSAIQLFARRGILATTMAELSRAIKMTPGALYWHFATKEDLLLAAIEELHGRFVQSFEPILLKKEKLTAKQRLEAFLQQTWTFLDEHREFGIFFGMVGAESAENQADVAAALRQALTVYVIAIAEIIEFGQQKTKEFRTDIDARSLANAIIFGNIGVLVQHNLFRQELTYAAIVQSLNDTIVAGVLKKK